MEKKLAWARPRMMQCQGDGDDCWASVIECALALFKPQTIPLSQIVQKFKADGGRFGAHGIKDFSEALKSFNILKAGAKSPDGFKQLRQVFCTIMRSIDQGLPVIVGWKLTWDADDGTIMSAKHAGIIFGYDTASLQGRVFVMEPIKIERDEWYNKYTTEPWTMSKAFESFGNMKGMITEFYLTKRPHEPASNGVFNPNLMNYESLDA